MSGGKFGNFLNSLATVIFSRRTQLSVS